MEGILPLLDLEAPELLLYTVQALGSGNLLDSPCTGLWYDIEGLPCLANAGSPICFLTQTEKQVRAPGLLLPWLGHNNFAPEVTAPVPPPRYTSVCGMIYLALFHPPSFLVIDDRQQ